MRRAVFLDRDGTLVEARHYPSRPEELVLVPGVARELVTLREGGYRLVLVSNQSGIGRGLFSERDLARMHAHLGRELRRDGAWLDAYLHCPHVPEDGCACRKPLAGMLYRAARELDIDLARSWMVGDILDDIEAGHRAGCRAVLVDRGTERLPASPLRTPDHVASDTPSALRLIECEVMDAVA